MKLRTILLGSALAAACAGTANAAASNHGWYVGVEAGANWIQDVDDEFVTPVFASTTVNVAFDTGWAAIATVGYAFWDSNWRVELEAGYRHNDIDSATALGGLLPPGALVDGGNAELSNMSIMANVLYDIELTNRLTFSIGAGAGAANTHLDAPNAGFPQPGGAGNAAVDDKDWNFAWQGIAGLSYAVTDRIDLTLNYRYFRVEDADFVGLGPVFFGTHDFDPIENHTVTIGLRFDLTADEAPPPPPGPPAPPLPPREEPRQFILFFGFNKANLTPEAHRVLEEAAAAAKQYGTAHILITGHTDTVGSHRYNKRLSIRRANAAKAGLVSEGISSGMITTVGKGETELLVQTADGVKEPQNRRAEVDLQ